MEWICCTFGGTISHIGHKEEKNRKPVLYWQLNGKKAKALLVLLAPYLKVKRKRAEVAYKFPIGKIGSHKYFSEEKKALQKEIHFEMRRLNKRGL